MANKTEYIIDIKAVGGELLQQLTVDGRQVEAVLGQIGEGAVAAGSKLKGMAQLSLVLDAAQRSLSMLRDTVNNMAGDFNTFETAMLAANTMAGKSGDDFDKMKDRVAALGEEIPKTREELAGGLYQVISNGVPEPQWLDFLEQSSKAAVGGIADLGQTVTVTSTIIKNYGLEWDQAGSIQDKIQMTAQKGVTSFEQLAQALPRVTGSASQLGVEVDELLAVFATTTGVTGNTAEVSTQLAAVLNSLVKPTAEATKAAEAMGIGFNASSVKAAGGLKNYLDGLDESISLYATKTGQLKETIYGQLFGSAEALRVLGSLTGEQKEKFAENIGEMSNSAGTIANAFGEVAKSGESENQMMKNKIANYTEWIGSIASAMAPYTNFLGGTGLAILGMTQLAGATKAAIASVKGIKVATLAHAAAAKVAVIASNAWKIAQIALNAVMSANPIALVVLAIAALVAIVIAAYNNCETFRNICDQVWAVVKELATAVWDFLVKAFQKACEVIKAAWEWVKKFFGIDGEGAAKQTAELEKNTKATKDNADAKAALAALQDNKKYNSPLTQNDKKTTKKVGKGDNDKYSGKALIANASSYKELGNNIQYYQNKLELTKGTEVETLALYAKKIEALHRQQEAITAIQEAAKRPRELTTLKAINDEISYQQELRERASQAELPGIDAEIARLNELKTAMERSSHVELGLAEIKTYKELEGEVQYYSDLLKTAGAEERVELQGRINALQALREKWDATLAELKAPVETAKLKTLGELEAALGYYQGKQKRATAEELERLARTIVEIEKKREALKELARLPALQEELKPLEGLAGKALVVELKLKLGGLDGVQKRLKELRAMLDRAHSPMTERQRGEVQRLIATYEQYEKTLKRSEVTVTRSWGAVKGIAGGIESLTEALKGNRGAWATIAAVVDSAIQVYQGLMGVVEIVKLLTGATKQQTTATVELGVAKVAQTSLDTASTAEEVANSTARATASGVETTADVAGAAAKTMKAHASIPLVGIAIGAGMVATLVGIMASLPKFANGGIAYGPTLGLFGEYAGASNNPEVVAPLDKLKSLLGTDEAGGGADGRVEFRVRGKDLVAVLANETNINRRKTNIKL